MVPSKNTEEVSQNGCGENTQVEEKEWLASLSEHELDFLISLKDLATTRAKNIGHEGVPADKLLASLSDCRLLDLNYDGNPDTITSASKSSNKDISFVSSKRKRMWDGLKEDASFSNKKQKNTDGA
ncbi:uncharacterized protein LOC110035026 isoform X2 [Phalaenopsis equestris]|uniref:uncharacterized protein LOC110035026 isoform X2 n=1 Tax=Phalaenopsis equestris TaxID=78828 RepID=UPI0009E1AB9C|nr:uncharacterized protein LOC110035026 isoform X2 [Phalaenopsis equestris]